MSLQEMAEFIKIDTSGCHGNSGMSKKQAGPVDRIQRTEKNRWPNIWPGLCMYILMKRDMSARLFLLCQICGFMCNYKSINNQRSRRSETILIKVIQLKRINISFIHSLKIRLKCYYTITIYSRMIFKYGITACLSDVHYR